MGADLYLYGENGWIEILTVVFLLIAILFGMIFLLLYKIPDHGWVQWWMVLLVLGSLYFAGEELSWGQHIFGWETSEYWQTLNDQGKPTYITRVLCLTKSQEHCCQLQHWLEESWCLRIFI